LKVLITTPSYPPFNSGLGNAVQRQAAVLVRKGFDVVIATSGNKRGQRRDEGSGAWVEEFAVRGADSWLSPISGDVDSYKKYLIDSSFDVVLMNAWQTWSTDLCLLNLSRIRGRKILYSNCVSTNVFFWNQPVRSLIRYLLWRPYWWRLPKWLHQLDGFIVTASEGCDSRFDDLKVARRLNIPFEVVPNALSTSGVECLENPVVDVESRRDLIAVGSYDWQKGHDFVLRAYAMSKAKNVISLKVFGQSFSPFTDRLRALAKSLGIDSKYLTFHEGVSGSALLNEYARARAVLAGSYTECQPLVLLDAMAAGTPFVARASGCIPMLPGGDSVTTESEMASAIDGIVNDLDKWNALSGEGRDAAMLRHHPDKVGQSLVSALTMHVSR
jgi:1,2-diacylglycerol 3-alpha-glucosyltransferase